MVMKTIRKVFISFVFVFFGIFSVHQNSEAQILRIVTVNTLSGAVTGSALGGATMALQDKSEIDYYPLRFGLGMGTIMGLGTGFYDLSKSDGGGYYVSGALHSSGTSGTIILLDTFYGAATGTIVGIAVSLMTESNILKGIQYGSGAGAWVGFAFGLVDAFVLSTPSSYDSFYDDFASGNNSARNGLLEIGSIDSRYTVGLLNPVIFNATDLSGRNGPVTRMHPGIEFTRINISL